MVITFAFLFEFVDTALGGGYGTVLAPLLLVLGFISLDVVPAILFSEIWTGLTGATMHHKLKNANFSEETKTNWKILSLISILGISATVCAVFIAISIDKILLNTYIGFLVTIVGALMLTNFRYKFSWKKIGIIGAISSFNKGISGGGFGPLLTAGQVVSGRDTKNAIATALACEFPICIAGLITYFAFKPITETFLLLCLLLTIGAIPASIIGAFSVTKMKDERNFKTLTGVFIVFLGIFVLLKTYKIIFS
ncbi:MAG: sulfite exporter TauE/SafE family protein [Candidatus Lokiarchaeota archaeon]|nr:sulfite exporter TauE/SafE family protein [Candidatus Lokiarchaeota archaeon]